MNTPQTDARMPRTAVQSRRHFLASSLGALSAAQALSAKEVQRRVGIIGHTGRGNYGHGLDKVWKIIPGCRIVGVADADPKGLKDASKRLGDVEPFGDYREMLKRTRPELVSVAPRHVDQHHDMIMAAIEAGAKGIYVEKPYCRTPAEADSILAASIRNKVKIAVAHRNGYHPTLKTIVGLIKDGAIGRLVEVRGHGAGDRRGGAEDLWVLGGHVFNLFHHFGGDPLSCSATILQDGRLATPNDVREGAEGLGPLLGNEIHARFLMSAGWTASYTTFKEDDSKKAGYAMHLLGTKGMISIHIDRRPLAWFHPGNPFDPKHRTTERIPVHSTGLGGEEEHPEIIQSVQNHSFAVRDLMRCVDEDRDPICDSRAGAMAVEMTCAAFESHRQGGGHVTLPLRRRDHPLSDY